MANWKGTLVPNSGLVEKVYFNTNLSIDEVKSILSTLNYPIEGEGNIEFVLATTDNNFIFAFVDLTSYGYGYVIMNQSSSVGIFSSDEATSNVFGIDFVGWNPDLVDGLVINSEVLSEIDSAMGVISIGTQNDKLTSLFSITPFTSGEETTADKLQKLIDNKQLIVDSVNAKAGTNYDIHSKPSDIANTITNIQSGGGGTNTSDATATASDILQGKTAYTADGKVEGTIETYDGGMTEGATSNLQVKNVTPSKNVQEVIPDSEYYGLSKVVVDSIPSEYIIPSGTLEITEKGEYDVKELEKVNVNIESGSGEDMLQARIDATNSCLYLFYYYKGTNVDYISGLDTSNVTSMNYMFGGCSLLTSIPLLNTSKVTDMSNMFYVCSALTSVPELDTSNVTYMSNMFRDCSALTSVPELDTSNVTYMNYMFQNCVNLTSIPQLNTSKVNNMSSMFDDCSKLTTIDITYYNISSTSNVTYFASNCTALKSLIIRSFGTSYALNTNSFQNSGIASGTGYIYVPRAMVDTLKSATNWSTYASQIRALEDYTIDGTITGALDESKI